MSKKNHLCLTEKVGQWACNALVVIGILYVIGAAGDYELGRCGLGGLALVASAGFAMIIAGGYFGGGFLGSDCYAKDATPSGDLASYKKTQEEVTVCPEERSVS